MAAGAVELKASDGLPLDGKTSDGKASDGKASDGKTSLCKCCGKPFQVTRKDKSYCGDSCRQTAWELRTGKKIRRGRV